MMSTFTQGLSGSIFYQSVVNLLNRSPESGLKASVPFVFMACDA